MFFHSVFTFFLVLALSLHEGISSGEKLDLMYSTPSQIKRFIRNEDGSNHTYLIANNETISLTYDFRNNATYFATLSTSRATDFVIFRQSSKEDSPTVIADTGIAHVAGLAFDWITGNIYFTDMEESRVGVCNNASSYCTILVQEEADKPKDIVLHPNAGIMFWTTWGNNPSIIRAGMDGSLPYAILSDELLPGGLTIDLEASKLYWVEHTGKKIESSRFDGSNRMTVIVTESIITLDIATSRNQIFWTEWFENCIKSVDKHGLSVVETVVKDAERVKYLEIFDEYNQPIERSNPCESANCSHICTLSPTQQFHCACPAGMSLDNDTITCKDTKDHPMLVYAYKNFLKIMPFNVIGKDVLSNVTFPSVKVINALVYYPHNHSLIFSDAPSKKVYEYKIDTEQLTVLIEEHLQVVKALDIDNVGQNLYWYDAGRQAIEAMSLKTRARVTVVANMSFLSDVDDILIVPDHGSIYVATSGPNYGLIYTMGPSGENITEFRKVNDGQPIALFYDKQTDNIFWVDKQTHKIESVSATKELTTFFPESFFSGEYSHVPSDLVIYQNRIYSSDMYFPFINVRKVFSSGFVTRGQMRIQTGNNFTMGSDGNLNYFPRLAILRNDISDLEESIFRQHECSPLNPGNKACSHVCLMTGQGNSGECRCPEGMSLDATGLTCIRPTTCPSGLFACSNGACINSNYVCDSDNDCDDGSDEVNCQSVPCPVGKFKCENDGHCIHGRFVCDDDDDCSDGSDERNCTMQCNEAFQFKCEEGNRCIDLSFKCDGDRDCTDNSDEKNCSCPTGFFKCSSLRRNCIPESKVCDGVRDCELGSDEYWTNCLQKTCADNEFKCTNGTCIDKRLVCDGSSDCSQGEDEQNVWLCKLLSTSQSTTLRTVATTESETTTSLTSTVIKSTTAQTVTEKMEDDIIKTTPSSAIQTLITQENELNNPSEIGSSWEVFAYISVFVIIVIGLSIIIGIVRGGKRRKECNDQSESIVLFNTF